jgi:membrane protein implicated in regulation of membrane protease activity
MSLSTLSSISPEIVWAFLGIVLVFVEFFIPGLVIAFFGVGALIVALTTWMGITGSLISQLIVFMVSSVLLLILLRKFLKRTFLGFSKGDLATRNFNVEVGKIVSVIEYIQPGEVGGKVRYQGTNWSAQAAEPIAPGESVRITGCENLTLLVEKIKKSEEEVNNG